MINNIFYRFYRFFKYTEERFTPEILRMPHHIASFFFIILLILNIGSTTLLLKILYGLNFEEINKLYFIVLFLVIYLSVYFSFIHKRKYLEIEEKYKEESKTKRVLGVLLASSYIVLTIVFLIIVASNR